MDQLSEQYSPRAEISLFGKGALITLLVGRGVLFSGSRRVLRRFAAALTYGMGLLTGPTVGG